MFLLLELAKMWLPYYHILNFSLVFSFTHDKQGLYVYFGIYVSVAMYYYGMQVMLNRDIFSMSLEPNFNFPHL